jgi:hypothetical protein
MPSVMTGLIRQLIPAFLLMLLPGLAYAQSSITGVVRDTSGGVLPGVTVEASSPALIEGVRTTVTDDRGLYRIIELRPGTYTVTFSLAGFQTTREENLQLPAGFTATVNPTLALGTVAETITVTREVASVDTVNIAVREVLSQEELDDLPLGESLGALRGLVVGAVYAANRQDVGGNQGENQQNFAVNGGRAGDFQQYRDGMLTNSLISAGNWLGSQNPSTIQETVVSTSGFGAMAQTGGATINMIEREGGNAFGGTFNVDGTSEALRSSNLTSALVARGVGTDPSIRQRYDVNGGFGGPLVRNRLWFFSGARHWIASDYQPGNYFNATPGTLVYTPDVSRPAYSNNYYSQASTRLTWQAAAKHKFTGLYVWERNCNCMYTIESGTLAPEAAGSHFYSPNRRVQATWTYPATDRLMLWAGVTDIYIKHNKKPEGGGNDTHRSILDQTRNYRYGAPGSGFGLPTSFGWQNVIQRNQNFTLSYLRGGHYLKAGFMTMQGNFDANRWIADNMSFRFTNGAPQSIDLFAGPYIWAVKTSYPSIFVEDQWTLSRLTLNLGLRYDGLRGNVPAQHLPAGPFRPAQDFAPVENSPNFHDLGPRLGFAYDLFGTGRTALKASLSRTVTFIAPGNVQSISNPVGLMVSTVNRTWNDVNRNFVPDCDLRSPDANAECGAISNRNFGTVVPGTQRDPEVLEGWHNREFSWQSSVSVDHQLRENVRLSVGYFRTWYGNFQVTDNRAVTPADYDPFCITAPADSRLPDGISGSQICGHYDLNPSKFGQVDNLIVHASRFGEQSEVYNGVNVSLSANHEGYSLGGGLTTGRTVTDACFVVDSPSQYQCRVSPSWYAGTQLKLRGVMPLPWAGLQASTAFQMVPSIPLEASYVVGNAQVASSLGRNLSGGATANRTINLIDAGTEFAEGWNTQLDFRVSGSYNVGGMRLQPNLDLFNVFNASEVLGANARYGPVWQNVTAVLGGRVVRMGVRVSF